MLTMRQFEVFWAIMMTESLTKAGDLLGISQPAMSKYLRNTEDVLGYKLFIRKNGRLRPSAEAELLIPFVTGIFDNVFSARRAALDLRNNRAGRLKVAAIPTLASELLPQAIETFVKDRPLVNVSLKVVSRLEAVARLMRQQVDIGLLYGPVPEPTLTVVDLR